MLAIGIVEEVGDAIDVVWGEEAVLAFASVAAVSRSDWDTRRVRDTMIPLDKVPLLTEDETAVDALAELSEPRTNRGRVVDNGHLAGLHSITDLARALEVGRRPAQAQGGQARCSGWWDAPSPPLTRRPGWPLSRRRTPFRMLREMLRHSRRSP